MQGPLAGNLNGRWISLVLVEHGLIVVAVLGGAVVSLSTRGTPAVAVTELVGRAMLVAVVLQVCLHYCDLYDLRALSERRYLFTGLLRALGAASVVLALLYYLLPALVIGRGVVAIASLPIIGFIAGWRLTFEWWAIRGRPRERLLIVGTGQAAVSLAREIFERRTELGAEIVGFVDADPALVGTPVINPRVIGTISDIPGIVRHRQVDRVVVSLADARGKLNMDELLDMRLNQGVRFDHLASVYEQYTGKIAVENLRPSWMIFSEGFRKSATQAGVKRALDVVLASIGLILAAPVMGLVAVAIRATSPGPVLYSQRRVGKDGDDLHHSQVSFDAGGRRGCQWRRLGDRRRSARDQGRTVLAPDPPGRDSAVVERADW